MMEPKPFASLTSGLLARKGSAQPAMRRPMMGFGADLGLPVQSDDLGWNDMGFDVEPAPVPMDAAPLPIGLTPMEGPVETAAIPQVVTARQALAERIGAEPEAAEPAADVSPAGRGIAAIPQTRSMTAARKAAFTLRLDADRHLRLRLASAVTGQSAQQLVMQALDDFLATLPEIDRLTQQLPPKGGTQ